MRLILASSLLLVSATAFASNCEHQADRSFNVDRADIKTLVAKLGSTDLRLRGVAGLARIEVQARACASNAGDLDRLTVSQRRDGDRLVIETERNRGSYTFSLFGSSYAYLELEIRVPATLAVDVDTGSGDVDARGLESLRYEAGSGDLIVENIAGELVADVGSGDVEGSDVGRFHLVSTGSGDFNLRDIHGDVEVGGVGSGDLTFRKVGGSVQIDRVGSGDVDLYEVGGDVSVDSIGSGDLHAVDVRGNLTVKSSGSGDISHRNIGGRVDVPDSD
ncbi:MAG TPA: DUF4097 family beta strand repeat-containing protein [Dokdonella sp.]|nr:DUF4097 family beta strand repeat-containing protein [Dokdonella sp.]